MKQPREGRRSALALLLALGIHAGLLFGFQRPVVTVPAEFGVDAAEAGIEVSLVAAPPAKRVAEVPPRPEPEPLLPAPETKPEPIPEPAQILLPEPPPRRPEPPRAPQLKTASKPRPSRVASALGDGSSAVPGRDATTAAASTGGHSSKPGYLRNPHPAYPEGARQAGQQGIVQLRVGVSAQGDVTSVSVSKSSGFSLLDERARSAVSERWKFKPARFAGRPVPAEVMVPIRFTIEH